jgi:hypothetical protein
MTIVPHLAYSKPEGRAHFRLPVLPAQSGRYSGLVSGVYGDGFDAHVGTPLEQRPETTGSIQTIDETIQ